MDIDMKLHLNKISTIVACVYLMACSPNKSADEYIISATANLKNQNEAAALIDLKNAIKADLKNSQARLLLGNLYLGNGQAAAAEKELRRALELGVDREKVLPKLLKSLNLQDKHSEVIDLVEQESSLADSAMPTLLLYQALAHSSLKDNKKAREAIERANEISAESIYSRLGNAYLKASSLNIDEALSNLEGIIDQEPSLIEAHLLQGQLLFIDKSYEKAIDSFKQYQQLVPQDLKIRLFLAHAYLKSEQFAEADKQVSILLQLFPEHAFSNQIKSIIAYQNQDFKPALAYAEKAIQNGLNDISNRALAGLSAFKLEQYEQAHQYLAPIAKSLPDSHPVVKVLAMVQVQLGYFEDAANTLEGMEALTDNDAELLTTVSFELLKEGNISQAQRLLNKSNSLPSLAPESMAQIGTLKLSINDIEGVTDLEKALEIDPQLPMAKMMLASAYIQSGKLNKALELANSWKKSNPEKVEGYNLTAKVLLIQNKISEAEQELEKALSISPSNIYSLLYFANKYLNSNQIDKAESALNKVLQVEPDNITALIQNHKLAGMKEDKEPANELIKHSFERNKGEIEYNLLYAKTLLVEKDFDGAIKVLSQFKDTNETTPQAYWTLLGNSYRSIQRYENMLATFEDWVEKQPHHRAAWLNKIATQELLKDYSGALDTSRKLLNKAPEDEQAKLLLINYLIINQETKEANIALNQLTEQQKLRPFAQGLSGQLALERGNYLEALPKLQQSYEAMNTSRNAGFVYTALMKLKRKNDAFLHLQSHLEEKPDDTISKAFLANLAVELDIELASKIYRELLEEQPDNLVFINNLAWVEYEQANYERAHKLIRRALELSPSHPQVMDTAARIEWKLGNRENAIELIKKAKLLAPDDSEIEKHYQEMVVQ